MKKVYLPLILAGAMVSCDQGLEESGMDANMGDIGLKTASAQQVSVQAEPLRKVDRDDRTINEISFPATHNTYNYKGSTFSKSNVFDDMPEQFEKGIRAVEIDIHEKRTWFKKDVSVYHGKMTNGFNGSRLAHYVLAEITEFIEDNPQEIVFLKFETTVSGSTLDKEIREAGLDEHIYEYDESNPYPTKEEVVASGKRVVITRHIDGSAYGRALDRHTFGGGYSDNGDHKPQSSPSEKKFFSVERYGITGTFGYGDADRAKYLNHPSRLAPFVDDVWKLNGKKPWRVIVDFPSVHSGNYYTVIRELNDKEMLKGEIRTADGNLLLKKDGKLINWTWECQYAEEMVTAKTSAEFSFPMNDGETVTIRPVSDEYTFVPASLTVTNDNTSDLMQVFTAVPK
ncbi:hypothetical protein FUAX_07180 [Fulvitalea axinellae]|uniref:Phosphatidylinositol diacylglycerol-lyase n=1 Tax=Fulvitalea axinellae TaxID=1182444 RepID=A0AAU9C859_9BACT|nr:hypothetical protein FUAX_07180 [Fulvitalea axinellae]